MLVVVGASDLVRRWEERTAGWGNARRPGLFAAVAPGDPVFELDVADDSAPVTITARDGRATVRASSKDVRVEIGPCGGRALFAVRQPGGWVVSDRLSWLADGGANDGAVAFDLHWLAARLLIAAPLVPTASPYRAVLTLPFASTTTLAPDAAARFATAAPPAAHADMNLAETFERVIARLASLASTHAVLVGGIDSSALVALASSKTKVLPVTLDLGGANSDRPFVEALSRYVGVEPLLVSPREAARDLAPDLMVEGAPMLWPTTAQVHACVRHARERGIRTVWSGLGGDELFEGSPRGASVLARAGRVREAVALTALGAPQARARAVLRNVVWASLRPSLPLRWFHALAPPSHSTERRWARQPLELFHAERLARVRLEKAEWEISRDEKVARYFRWNQFGLYSFDRHLVEHASGVLRLDPYLDPEIVRAACSLPEHALIEGAIPRAPLRELLRGRMPEEVRLRHEKADFLEACAATFRAIPVERWRALATPSALADLGLVEPRSFRAEYDAFEADLEGHPEGWLRLWPVLACEALVRGVARLPDRFPGGVAA